MRKTLMLLFVVVLAFALVVGACGSKKQASSSSSSGSGTAGGMTAQQIFDKAMTAGDTVKTMNATVDAKVDFKTSSSASPDAASAALTQGPITVNGTIAADTNQPEKADVTMTIGVSGQSIQVGLRMVGSDAWINYMGQWYVAPPDITKQLGQSPSPSATASTSADPLAELKTLGIDPKLWVKTESVVGEETVAGVQTYHIRIDVDPSKMVDDLMKALQSPEAQKALSGQQAQQLQQISGLSASDSAKIKAMFKSATLDMWVQTDTYVTRKMQIAAEIAPPADQAGGISSMSMSGGVTLDTINQPVTVEAPTGALPWKDLQKQLGGLLGTSGL